MNMDRARGHVAEALPRLRTHIAQSNEAHRQPGEETVGDANHLSAKPGHHPRRRRKETEMQDNPIPLRPLKAARARCLDCAESPSAVKRCEFHDCSLYSYRFGRQMHWGKEKPVGYKPVLRAIRAHCLWCCKDSRTEVRLCPAEDCPLWLYRFGEHFYAGTASRRGFGRSRKRGESTPASAN